ncbi:neprilysin-2 [Microplitis demolitor]|uniref:neprilysin-2 n=1 Tax=Microplitis demolitor TaxID=69319 RepID=UPI0004CDB7ED|nr:neprilysin-2 [Microplitis demolitor]
MLAICYFPQDRNSDNKYSTMYQIFNNLGQSRVSLLDRPLFLIVIIGFIWSLISINDASVIDTTRNNVVSNKCTSTACSVERLETAARIIRYRDDTINPCDNFPRFACGNYKKTDKSNDYNYLLSQKHDHLEKLIQKGIFSDFKPYKLIDDIYKTCMNREARGQQGLDLMKRIIKTLGNWPILEANRWKESEFNWIDFTSNAKKSGYNINYFLDWQPLYTNHSNKWTLRYSIRMAGSYFDNSMSTTTTMQKQMYADYMLRIARSLGANIGDTIQELKEAFQFENKLHEIISGDDSCHMNNNNIDDNISIEKLQKQWPSIDWNRFVDKTLIPFVDSNEKPILTVWNSTALTEFVKLMEKTPKRVQANYAIWKIVQYSVPYLTEEFREMQQMFQKLVGYVGMPADDDCLETAKAYTKYALLNLYLDQFKSSRETIKQMVITFKDQITKMIKESKTLSDEAKNEGINILKEMSFTIGPSNKLSNSKELKKFYADAQVVKDNFLQTLLNLNLFKIKKDFSIKLLSEINPHNMNKLSTLGIPNYMNGHLNIPAAMIPSPLFNNDRPMYMNFGSSGSYIALSIASAVSHVGRNQTVRKELIDKQLDCFRNHIDDSTDELKKKNMPQDRSEEDMIAQYIGFRTSWAAYQDYVTKLGTEPTLEGLPYTQEQLFWISFAQSFCFEYENINEPRNLHNNQLNIHEYNIMKIFSNIPEISADFQCPVGSNMNKEPKCTWW